MLVLRLTSLAFLNAVAITVLPYAGSIFDSMAGIVQRQCGKNPNCSYFVPDCGIGATLVILATGARP
ncbi:hypothetical protein NL440_26560, partial [Klebsiella pneumoniae]|nr:hypothetical protein [Klebsiella pneumoniae]